MRTFEEVWQDIKELEGKDVYTLVHRHKNYIVEVDETGMIIRPNGSEYNHPVTKGAFKTVCRKLIENG